MISIRDPIYRVIEVEDEFVPLINNPYFQRLRDIKQNSLLYFVYPSAKHDRFSHSLGVYHLMCQVLNNKHHTKLSKKDVFNLKAAALLHDIGHGPYSHLWEMLVENFDHEEMSVKIIEEVFKLPDVAKIIQKKHPLSQLLSSVIDVDKLDYMARDSYFCGVGYGDTDVERITSSMRVRDGKIIIDAKVATSVEHVINGRISLFKSTYYHHLVWGMDVLLKKIFLRVKKVKEKLVFDDILKKFLDGNGKVKDFLYLDDSLIKWHLHKWKDCKDTILKDLVDRFLRRGGFKSVDPVVYGLVPQQVKKEIAKTYDVEYYFEDAEKKKGVYENELYVEKKTGELVPLTMYSQYISRIVDIPIYVHYVVGPEEFITKLKGGSNGS